MKDYIVEFARRLFSPKHREFYHKCNEIVILIISGKIPTIEEIATRLINQQDEPTHIKPFTNKILMPPKIEKELGKLREIQNAPLSPYNKRKYGKRRLKTILKRTYKLAKMIKKYYDKSAYRALMQIAYDKEVEKNWRNGKWHFGMWLGNIYRDD